jgi:hypothetical protein
VENIDEYGVIHGYLNLNNVFYCEKKELFMPLIRIKHKPAWYFYDAAQVLQAPVMISSSETGSLMDGQ